MFCYFCEMQFKIFQTESLLNGIYQVSGQMSTYSILPLLLLTVNRSYISMLTLALSGGSVTPAVSGCKYLVTTDLYVRTGLRGAACDFSHA